MKNKTIVITGANGALGKAVVECAQAQGANVIAVDLGFGGSASSAENIVADLSDPTALSAALGRRTSIDGLFNIAGGFDMGPEVHETDANLWDRMFKMNVETARNACAAVVPTMLAAGSGSIVNVGALSAQEGQGNMGAYCAAKSTVMRLTESMSKELRQRGINVNAVLPSIIDTPTNRADMPDTDHSKWVPPRELAEVICFLGSDRARAIHGALVPVSGLS